MFIFWVLLQSFWLIESYYHTRTFWKRSDPIRFLKKKHASHVLYDAFFCAFFAHFEQISNPKFDWISFETKTKRDAFHSLQLIHYFVVRAAPYQKVILTCISTNEKKKIRKQNDFRVCWKQIKTLLQFFTSSTPTPNASKLQFLVGSKSSFDN